MDERIVLDELTGKAASLLEYNISDDAVILLKTASGNIYDQLIHCVGVVRHAGLPKEKASYEAEVSEFLAMLREKNDTYAQYILLAYNGQVVELLDRSRYSIGMPPFCIRKGLIELDPRNADTVILTNSTHNMKIIESIPPVKQV